MKKLLMYTFMIVLWGTSGKAIEFENDMDEDIEVTTYIRYQGESEYKKTSKWLIKANNILRMSLWCMLSTKGGPKAEGAEKMKFVVENVEGLLPIPCKFNDKIMEINISNFLKNEENKNVIRELNNKILIFFIPEGKRWWDAAFIMPE